VAPHPRFVSRIIFSALVALVPLAAQAAVVTIPYKGPGQIQDLQAHGAQVIAFTRFGVDIEADEKTMSYIMSKPWAPGNVVPQQAPPPGGEVIDANLGLYHTYDENEAALGALVAAYPTLADTIRIGKAYAPNNRNITAIKISDNVLTDENEPEVLYMGNHHARELMSVEIPLKFAQYLLANYGTDPVVTNYDSQVRVERDGLLRVAETWKLSNVNGTFTRFIVTQDHLPDDIDHVQEIGDLTVKAGGQDKKAELKTEGDVTSIAVPDVSSGTTQLDFTYTVKGAVAVPFWRGTPFASRL